MGCSKKTRCGAKRAGAEEPSVGLQGGRLRALCRLHSQARAAGRAGLILERKSLRAKFVCRACPRVIRLEARV